MRAVGFIAGVYRRDARHRAFSKSSKIGEHALDAISRSASFAETFGRYSPGKAFYLLGMVFMEPYMRAIYAV